MAGTSLLEEREQELYRQGQPVSSGIPTEQPVHNAPNNTPPGEPPRRWQRPHVDWGWIDRAPLKKGVWVVLILAVLVAAVLLWRGLFSFQSDRVSIVWEPVTDVPVGEEVGWEVRIDNGNFSSITDGTLTILLPEKTLDAQTGEVISRVERTVSSVPGRGSYTEEVEGVFVAGSAKEARVLFSFKQENSNAVFEEEAVFSIEPTEFPVHITVDVPAETLSGEEIAINATIRSTASVPLRGLRARLVYPTDVIIQRASVPLENAFTVWPIGELSPGEEAALTVFGVVSGQAEEGKVFRVVLEGASGPTTWERYKENSGETRLAQTPFELEVVGPSSARPQEELSYTIRWRNAFDVPLAHVTVSAQLTGGMINIAELQVEGAVDARTNTITWSEAHIPSLASVRPGEGGEVTLSVPLRGEYQPIGVANPAARVRVIVSSPTVPRGLTTGGVRTINEHETRIAGDMVPQAAVVYAETLSPFRNTGPYPPRLGSDTTFTVHWRLTALANSFVGVTMSATLPSGVEWADETYINGEYGTLHYEPFSRTVTWQIGELKANQGLFSQVPEAVFKVRLRPTPAQVRQSPPLLSETTATGRDVFANVEVGETISSLNTNIGGSNGSVQP